MAKKTENEKSGNKERSIGIDVAFPKESCTDEKCPFHGKLKVHGATIVGNVSSSKASKTVTVSYTYPNYIQKYERFEKKYTKVKAHNPPCINAKEGDKVRIMETRPLSKTKHFVVVERME